MTDLPPNIEVNQEVSGDNNHIIGVQIINNYEKKKVTLPSPVAVPSPFLGHEKLLVDISAALEAETRILLYGMGGIGKTALASKAAEKWLNSNTDRQVLWLTVGRGIGLEALLNTIGKIFEKENLFIGISQSEKLSMVRAWIGEIHPFVILDDLWDGNAMATLLEVAFPPGIPVLVTSRIKFPNFDMSINTPSLARSDSLELLNSRAKRNYLVKDVYADQLCDLLENLPYALKIASAWLEVTPDMSVKELYEKVSEKMEHLKMPDDFAQEGRESIAALLAASIDELAEKSPDAEKVFWSLGTLFAPRVTPELFGLLIEQSTNQAREMLRILEKRSLLRYISLHLEDVTLGYYELHNLTYSFVASPFRAKPGENSKEFTLKACVKYAGKHAFPFDAFDGDSHHNALEVERLNLLGAIQWAASQKRKQWKAINQLVLALSEKSRFLHQHGYLHDAINILELGIKAAQALKNPIDEARHHKNLGTVYAEAYKVEPALEESKKGIEIVQRMERENDLELLDLEQRLLNDYGRALHYGKKDWQQAEMYYERAIEICKRLKDNKFRATILVNLGLVYSAQGKYLQAIETYDEGIALAKASEDEVAICKLLNNKGLAYEDWGKTLAINDPEREEKLREAGNNYRASYELAVKNNDRVMQSTAAGNFGLIKLLLEELDEAEECFERANKIAHEIEQRGAEVDWLDGLGDVAVKRADRADNLEEQVKFLQQAIEYFERALKLAEEIDYWRKSEIQEKLKQVKQRFDEITGANFHSTSRS